MDKKIIVILLVGILLVCLCACLIIGVAAFFVIDADTVDGVLEEWNFEEDVAPIFDDVFSNDEKSESIYLEDGEDADVLQLTDERYVAISDEVMPENDAVDVAVQFGYLDAAPSLPSAPIVNYQVGDQRDFLVSDDDSDFTITATLEASAAHVMVWVEDGVYFDEADLNALLNEFNSKIYTLDQRLFGSEWSPGIDGDRRIVILYAKDVGEDTAGYFSADDELPVEVSEVSNMAEMFVLNANVVDLNEEYTFGTLAHEYQHMIHWYLDSNEDLWLDEGLAELAAFLGDYELEGLDYEFLQTPDFQLNTWDDDNSFPHYGASFSFMNYVYNRVGEGLIRQIVQSKENGFASIDAVLKANGMTDWVRGETLTAEDLVLDWMVTNYLLDANVSDGRFDYKNYVNAPQVSVDDVMVPCAGDEYDFSVKQFGADYLKVDAGDGFALYFDGDDLMELVPVDMRDGDLAFWSQSMNNSSSVLMREFDLRNVSGDVWMDFAVWYDVEDDYDYVYLMVSDDGGVNWDVIETKYGEYSEYEEAIGWTGASQRWLQEEVDLTDYAGKKILVRFEALTDSVVSYSGFLVDDVVIDAIGYKTSFENDDAGWTTEGFVRVNGYLPQLFNVAAVIENGNDVQVEYVEMGDGNQFDFSIDAGEADTVTFVISGATRYTTKVAGYSVWFE